MTLLSSLHVLFVTTTTLSAAFLVAIIFMALFAGLDVLLVAAAPLTGAALVLFIAFAIGHLSSSCWVPSGKASNKLGPTVFQKLAYTSQLCTFSYKEQCRGNERPFQTSS